jgi:predicted nucleotidyltransferase
MVLETQYLKSYLQNNPTIVFGYLFGSYANGTYTSSSDVDIALYLSDLSLDSRLQISYELSKLLKKDVDLIVLNEVKNIYLLENILNDSIVIKDSEQRIDFELVKQHDIFDYKEFKRMIGAA